MDELICHWTEPAAHVRVSGSDAAAFLQGQFSNDLRRTGHSPATYGLWLNHKGRVLADSYVLQVGQDAFAIVSRTTPAATILQRLEAYIIADDVVLEDVSAQTSGALLAGPRAADVLGVLGTGVPEPGRFGRHGELVVLSARCGPGAWLVVAPRAIETTLRQTIVECRGREVPQIAFDRARLAAGIPVVPDELGPDDLPNEGGLDHDAISYTKGCYLGQEVMARLHHLGQVRRRLHRVRVMPGEARAAKGAPLFLGDRRCGEIRALVPMSSAPDSEAIGLAMLATHGMETGLALGLEPQGAPLVRVDGLAEGRAT